jgi:hypothetical protein
MSPSKWLEDLVDAAAEGQGYRHASATVPLHRPSFGTIDQNFEKRYASSVLTDPGKMTVITPPHAQWHWALAVSAGMPPTTVWGAGGVHGATVTGMHGMGVSTPRAAAVAAATVGLARLVHIPKGAMLTIGAMSVMVAAGFPSTITLLTGSTLSAEGANPKLHSSCADDVTQGCPIHAPPKFMKG